MEKKGLNHIKTINGMLSKKVEIDFLKWCDTNIAAWEYRYVLRHLKNDNIKGLISYLELFFDSVGIELVVFKWKDRFTMSIYIDSKMKISAQFGKDKTFQTRQEAWKSAIIRADEIYNKK